MRLLDGIVIFACAGGMLAPTGVLANSWCATTFPGAVFCDDFDRYCTPAPPEGQACTGDPDGQKFWAAWIPTGPCSSAFGLDSLHIASPPWGVKTNTQNKSTLGLARRSLAPSIRAKFGDAYSAVMATDLNPLVWEVVMQANRPRFDNSYLSLGTGFTPAPTDFAYSSFCSCTSPQIRWPIICAQEPSPAGCPPISAAPQAPCIAVGFVTYLDTNPCHCETSSNSPVNDHLSFYDGRKWYRLREGLFTGSGDFRLRSSQHRIKVTIRATTLKVELSTPALGEYSWCELPRDYMGAFSSMTMGYAVPCHLKTGAWECRNDPYDPICGEGAPSGSVPYYDNLVLHGGVPAALPGACCFPNTSCMVTFSGDCVTLGGQPAGPETTCEATPCCPPLKIDHDLDQDIDQADFGRFQTCLSTGNLMPPPTIPCLCADLDNDGDVDGNDFTRFLNCMRGPNILVDPRCTD